MDKIDPDRTVTSWDELVTLETDFSNVRNPKEWVFRGEAKHQEPTTSLQRVCEQFAIKDLEIPRLESLLLYEFKRNYPLFARSVEVDLDDTLYWISLMRHYGAPTRFLDFTYSFFIASFFALERPAECGRDRKGNPEYYPAAVWAINKGWLTEHMARLMIEIDGGKTTLCEQWENREGEAFKRIFWEQKPPKRTVFAVNPLRLHERLHVQQGLFLCPGDISVSFEKNLFSLDGWKKKDNVRLILIDSACRQDVLWRFQRAGLGTEQLFPGLDGFARSLSIAGPLLYTWRQNLERSGNRLPSDDSGKILWNEVKGWKRS